jgi:outer membrane protein
MISKMNKTKNTSTKFKILVLLLLFSVTKPAFSQSIDTLSISKCIEMATKNNQNLKNKKLDESINQAKIKETIADLYPQLKLKGSYQYFLNAPKSLVSSGLFGGPAGQYTFAEFQVPQNINASADVSWQVYNPSILAALKINKFSQSLSELSTKDQQEMMVYDVSATYLNIQINELQVDLTRSNIKNLQKNLDLTNQLYTQGFVLKSDVDNLRISVVNLETVLSNQLNGLQQLYNLLKVYMGISPTTPISIEKFKKEDIVFNPITEIDFNVQDKRTGYNSVKQSGELLQLERKTIKSGYLPTVNLIGSFGYGGANPEFNFMKSYNNKWNPTNFVQLNVEIPVFDGLKKRNQLVKNKLQLEQNQNTLENLKNTFQMEMLNATNNYNHYIKDLDFQSKNLALANKLYTQKQLEYKNNTDSLSDIITVDNTVKTAQTNYLNTLIQLKITALDLKKTNGQLLNNQ